MHLTDALRNNAFTSHQALGATFGFSRASLHGYCIFVNRLQFFSWLHPLRVVYSWTSKRSSITLHITRRFICSADSLPRQGGGMLPVERTISFTSTIFFLEMGKLFLKSINSTWIHKVGLICAPKVLFQHLGMILQNLSIN
uniref:Mitogen-activated protein kinase 12-like n=1 Tax=Rhizophora mucronata TaxID=61149 RepID=A0A2P2M7B2_RHIMU